MDKDGPVTIGAQQLDSRLVEQINRITTISAAMWMTVVGTLGILFLPLMVSGIIDELAFTKQQAGYVGAAEMAGVAIASGTGVYWVRRCDWTFIGAAATIVMIIANLLSATISDFPSMFAARFLVGVASGTLLAIGLACQSDGKNADRVFGYWVACQMVIQSLGYLLLPSVRLTWGTTGFFLTLALLSVTCFISVLYMPRQGLFKIEVKKLYEANVVSNAVALLGALLFFMAQGGLWAFLERLGLAAQLSTTQIGFALAISSYFGVLGGLARNWLAYSAGLLSPFFFVIAGELLMLLFFASQPGNALFIVAVCLLQFCWAMGMASLLAGFNVLDKSGGLILLMMSTAKGGYSLGPALMGWLIIEDDYTLVLITSAALVTVGMLTAAMLVKTKSPAAFA